MPELMSQLPESLWGTPEEHFQTCGKYALQYERKKSKWTKLPLG